MRAKIDRRPESSLLLAISHDVDVFAAREVFFGRGAEERPWIRYLEGLPLERDTGGRLTARWCNDTVRVGSDLSHPA
ncbi:MAG: hypothetical protein WB778_08360 [Thermoplasmata archaeon]